MKSTLKIDYERSQENYPVIKIIVPNIELTEPKNEKVSYVEDIDEDVRDKLIRDFLHAPLMAHPNDFFEVRTTFPFNGNTLTTIGAVLEDRLFYTFRHAILNRIVPYDTIAKINSENIKSIRPEGKRTMHEREDIFNKINEFFDWVEKQPYRASLVQEPKDVSEELKQQLKTELTNTR